MFAVLSLLHSGCATTATMKANRDPFENLNRPFHNLNHKLDIALLKPAAEAYHDNIPKPVQNSVTNFFSNLGEPNTIVNSLLQGKGKQALHNTVRFLLNTTVGIGGLIDVASHEGVKKHKEDLGQTLAVWGFGEGPYLVLPIMGPTTLRDVPNRFVGKYTNLFNYFQKGSSRIPRGIVGTLNTRVQARGAIQEIDNSAMDRYIFVRQAYRDTRRFDIFDGDPPIEDLLDDEMLFEDDDFFFEDDKTSEVPQEGG